MLIINAPSSLSDYLGSEGVSNARVGFIPTMGAIHEGHLSLIKQSKKDNPVTICSIFVNPTQFNDPQDLTNYPKKLIEDSHKLRMAGVDALFVPSIEDIYPNGNKDIHIYDFGKLESIFEGTYREGHFTGVGQVVSILLDFVSPDVIYLGQKDYQQFLILKHLIKEVQHRHTNVRLCPIIREPDGLAMSSRNELLNTNERLDATSIYSTLMNVKASWHGDADPKELRRIGVTQLQSVPSIHSVEYFEVANADDLSTPERFEPGEKYLALAAVQMKNVRLIDNMFLNA